jgi:hypothetical protein
MIFVLGNCPITVLKMYCWFLQNFRNLFDCIWSSIDRVMKQILKQNVRKESELKKRETARLGQSGARAAQQTNPASPRTFFPLCFIFYFFTLIGGTPLTCSSSTRSRFYRESRARFPSLPRALNTPPHLHPVLPRHLLPLSPLLSGEITAGLPRNCSTEISIATAKTEANPSIKRVSAAPVWFFLLPISWSILWTLRILRFGRRTTKPTPPEGHSRKDLLQPCLAFSAGRPRLPRPRHRLHSDLPHPVHPAVDHQDHRNAVAIPSRAAASPPATPPAS